MPIWLEGNILDVSTGIVCHQVNCRGAMGAGLALQIRKKYPVVYQEYLKKFDDDGWMLGDVQIVRISRFLEIANLAGQYDYGRTRKQYTDYDALRKALRSLVEQRPDTTMYFPFLMGCGLAGGCWDDVYRAIAEIVPWAVIVRLS